MRKPVLSHMRITKAQISLRTRAVGAAPLLFAVEIVYNLHLLNLNVNIPVSLCS